MNEFHFYIGLRQGDPLSHFLFILVTESLHVAFSRVVDRGIFQGIHIDSDVDFCISHLFYADDAIFLGEWKESNVFSIVHVLRCFFFTPGLKINLSKSSLLGIGVPYEHVSILVNDMGCGNMTLSFPYLGLVVSGMMNQISSWREVVAKIVLRFSRQKVKTLSIGGGLTLIKPFLGSMPTFFYVPF